ncbi:MAG: patatin-like phospholipase family protein [Chryseolinea sp.]
MRNLVAAFLVVSATLSLQAQPKIGLTLSGGGSKGLAHIGILQAIDSAGLRIDYITGTSMGSILGSLYAVGYSGKEIEKAVRDLDWNFLFSGKPSMRTVNIDEKTEFDNYTLEVPFHNGKLKIITGIIEGQELWLKFQELFLPIYDIKDFSKFSIPFRCVATDMSTGKPVVLDQGELVTAIRASMAIPSIFTPVDYKDTKLIDGGIVRNFPVSDVKAMGADFVIGVNVAHGLLKAKELNSAIDILYQIGFYKDADNNQQERNLCNILIEPPLRKFSASSFNSADSIIRIGKEAANRYYPRFKKLADSLRAIYPNYAPIPSRLPQTRSVTVDSIRINGLVHTTNTSFKNRLALEPGKTYNGVEVAQGIRRVYGSRNFSRIAYEWHPLKPPGHASLTFNVVERPLTVFKAGIHYHSFSDVALILGGESKNLIFDRSKSSGKINLSENFRVLLEHNQLFGAKDNNNLILSFYHETFRYPLYQNFKRQEVYRSRTTNVDVKLQHTFGFSSAIGLGTTIENFRIKPANASEESFRQGNTYAQSYLYYRLNTLNKRNFSTRGWLVESKIGAVYGQNPTAISTTGGVSTETSDTLNLDTYARLQVKAELYVPLARRFTFLTQFNTGINFTPSDAYLNYFGIGGINDFVRNQIPFTGLPEYASNSHSVSVLMLGLQWQLTRSLYTTLRLNAAVYDYLADKQVLTFDKYLSGAGVSIGYDSGIGPLSITTMYNYESDKVYGYVNIGFPFR